LGWETFLYNRGVEINKLQVRKRFALLSYQKRIK